MKRQFTTAMIAVLAIGSLIGLAPTTALAQDAASACFPPAANGDYPPTSPAIESPLLLSFADGFLLPGRTDGHLTVQGGQAGLTYCGTLFSAPVTLTPTVAGTDGAIHFANINVPSDFQLNVTHHLDVFRQQHLVGAYDFCVTSSGSLAAPGSPSCTSTTSPTAVAGANGTATGSGSGAALGTKAAGSLPHTGWDHLIQVLKAAALALGLGALFMYLRRRRAAQVAQG